MVEGQDGRSFRCWGLLDKIGHFAGNIYMYMRALFCGRVFAVEHRRGKKSSRQFFVVVSFFIYIYKTCIH